MVRYATVFGSLLTKKTNIARQISRFLRKPLWRVSHNKKIQVPSRLLGAELLKKIIETKN